MHFADVFWGGVNHFGGVPTHSTLFQCAGYYHSEGFKAHWESFWSRLKQPKAVKKLPM